MVIQTANIVAGFMLAAPKLKEFGASKEIASVHEKLSTFAGAIGVMELVLGAGVLSHSLVRSQLSAGSCCNRDRSCPLRSSFCSLPAGEQFYSKT